MIMSNKIMKSTIAMALVAAGISGTPFSSNGLAETFGVHKAEAASSVETTVLNKLNAIFNALDEAGKIDLRKARESLQNLTNEQKQQISAPIVSKTSLSSNDKVVLNNLFVELISLPYNADGKGLDSIINNSAYRKVIASLSVEAGLGTNLTVDQFLSYGLEIESKVRDRLLKSSLNDLLLLLTDTSKQNEFIVAVLNDIRANEGDPINKLFSYYGITPNDLNQVNNNLRSAISTKVYDNAMNAFIKAYITTLDLTPGEGNPGGGNPGGGNPGEGNPGEGNPGEGNPGEGNPGEGNPGGGNPGEGNSGSANPGNSTAAVDAVLNDFLNKIEKATTAAEKQALVQQAVDAVVSEIKKQADFNASSLVTTSNGQSVVDLGSELLKSLQDSQKLFDKIQQFLKDTKSTAVVPAVPFVINMGDVDSNSLLIKLSDEAMKQWSSSPFSSLDLVVNKLTVSIPNSKEFGKSLQLTVDKDNEQAVKVVDKYTSVSSVYDFKLVVGGQPMDQFVNPVTLRIPLGDLKGVDKELLSVAKIVGDKLQWEGGDLNGDVMVEPRSTFSSYVVIEHKVSFKDIASVQSWAGRQIEVLAAKGAIEGRGNDQFQPKASVTRAEFAKMLIHALNLDSAGVTNSFKDVNANSWYASYVSSAVKHGIIYGRTSDSFAPNAAITRAEMATMVSRALKETKGATDIENVEEVLSQFKDASSINSTLKAGVALAASQNIVIGSDGMFRPNSSASRAEAAVMIYRTMNSTK